MCLFTKKQTCFAYTGIDAELKPIQQMIVADNKLAAIEVLRSKQIQIISIRHDYFNSFFKSKIKLKDLWLFSSQLVNTLKAAIPLAQALIMLYKQSPKPLKAIIKHCIEEIKQGKPFSKALAQSQASLPNTYLCFIEAGEMHGDLAASLQKANDFLAQKIELRRLFKKALTYPIIIVLVSIVIVIAMIAFIIPQFQQMYAQMGSQLPWLTQTVIGFFDALSHYTPILLSTTTLLSITTLLLINKKPSLKIKFQKGLLSLPLLGRYFTLQQIIPWLSLLGSCLQSGIAIKPSLHTATQALSIAVYKQPMPQIIKQVENGHLLSQSLRQYQWLEEEDLSFICMGETNGELGKAMLQQATLLQNQMTQQVESLSRLLEPLILVILALLVGSLLIALYLPLFQMGQLF